MLNGLRRGHEKACNAIVYIFSYTISLWGTGQSSTSMGPVYLRSGAGAWDLGYATFRRLILLFATVL